MMTRSLKIAASAFAAVLTLTAAAQAQTPGVDSTRVNVPFAFEIGSTHFAPGVYNLKLQSAHILRIQGVTSFTTGALMINAETTVRPASAGKVVFERIGTKYFLTQVYAADSTNYLQTVKTTEMKQARRDELATLGTQPNALPETTTLAMLR